MSEELKPPKSLGSAAAGGTKAALGPRWPSAEAGLLGVCEAGKAPPAPCTFSAGSRLRRRWLASLGLLLLLPMVLAGGDRNPRGRGEPLEQTRHPTHLADRETEVLRRGLATLGGLVSVLPVK